MAGRSMTQYIFVTGGVVSSLGKGIVTASLAAVLEARGIGVNILKMDPYINVDPGTTPKSPSSYRRPLHNSVSDRDSS